MVRQVIAGLFFGGLILGMTGCEGGDKAAPKVQMTNQLKPLANPAAPGGGQGANKAGSGATSE